MTLPGSRQHRSSWPFMCRLSTRHRPAHVHAKVFEERVCMQGLRPIEGIQQAITQATRDSKTAEICFGSHRPRARNGWSIGRPHVVTMMAIEMGSLVGRLRIVACLGRQHRSDLGQLASCTRWRRPRQFLTGPLALRSDRPPRAAVYRESDSRCRAGSTSRLASNR